MGISCIFRPPGAANLTAPHSRRFGEACSRSLNDLALIAQPDGVRIIWHDHDRPILCVHPWNHEARFNEKSPLSTQAVIDKKLEFEQHKHTNSYPYPIECPNETDGC